MRLSGNRVPLIKRYPNRKLYDTEARHYVTLEMIAAMLSQGKQVRVVDHASGEDLTTLILAQIIVEQEKKRASNLTLPLLTAMLRVSQGSLNDLLHFLFSSLGWMHLVEEEIRRRLAILVAKGELASEEGLRLLEKLSTPGYLPDDPQSSSLDLHMPPKAPEGLIPTRSDIERLRAQIDELAAKLDQLSHKDTQAHEID